MPKRQDDDTAGGVSAKKGRFAILADFDDGNKKQDRSEEGPSEQLNAEERVEKALKWSVVRGRNKPSINIKKASLSLRDFTNLCHSFAAKNETKRPFWLMFNHFKLPSQLVMLRINCTNEQLCDENKELTFLAEFFKSRWTPVDMEVRNLDIYWDSLLHVAISKRSQLKTFFQQQQDPLKEFHSEDVVKLALLTTSEDMANMNYPIHGFEQDEIVGVAPVVPTKDQYSKVTKDSPIFVLDCEMCVTDLNISELTRVTLIDENGDTLIDTFVKPFNKIVDYVTCFSGVTEESLRGVSVRLAHVQEAFRRLLPPNAILCGHSIENDLKALRLSHPYCIDVGFAYNMIDKKGANIIAAGHCSYEDAWAALRLLKLKLEHGLQFGSIALGFDYPQWAKSQNFYETAHLFTISTAKDFAKEPYKEVTLPEPREVSQCLTCKTPINSQCYIPDCPCSKHAAKFCCFCVAKDAQPSTVDEAELFHFGKALSDLKTIFHRPTLQEHLNTYRKPAKVMVARYLAEDEKASELTDKNVHTYDMAPFKTVKEVEEQIMDERIMTHDLCLLEWNAQEKSMAEMNQAVMQHVCGVLAHQAGFDTSSISALTRLSDMASNQMNEICRMSKLFCDNAGRTIPIDKDIEMALNFMNVSDVGLVEEFNKCVEAPEKYPALQIRPSKQPNNPKVMRVGEPHRPSYVPNFLPPFPDPHTYMQTEIVSESDVSYARHRELCANHQRNIDNSLISFLATRYPTTSLFRSEPNQPNSKKQYKILAPYEDNRPYLAALLPPESLDEMEL
ncbi:putative rnase h [Aphelenchoides bicaudatus]|nr:putative rnase h [Aphelenchoides bicaudatus]